MIIIPVDIIPDIESTTGSDIYNNEENIYNSDLLAVFLLAESKIKNQKNFKQQSNKTDL